MYIIQSVCHWPTAMHRADAEKKDEFFLCVAGYLLKKGMR